MTLDEEIRIAQTDVEALVTALDAARQKLRDLLEKKWDVHEGRPVRGDRHLKNVIGLACRIRFYGGIDKPSICIHPFKKDGTPSQNTRWLGSNWEPYDNAPPAEGHQAG